MGKDVTRRDPTNKAARIADLKALLVKAYINPFGLNVGPMDNGIEKSFPDNLLREAGDGQFQKTIADRGHSIIGLDEFQQAVDGGEKRQPK